MGSTARYTWPYPEQSDRPRVQSDLINLATSVEETVGAIDDRLTTLTGQSQSIMQYTTLYRSDVNDPMSIPSGQWTPIIWDTAQFNLPTSTPGFLFHNPTRITAVQSGLYQFIGFAGFAQNSTGSRALAFRVNGYSTYPALTSGLPPSDIEWYGSVAFEGRLNVNDYLELCVRQTSGAPLLMDTVFPRFSVRRMV